MRIVVDLADARLLLTQIRNRVANLSPLWSAIGQDATEQARLQFRDSRDPYGVQWKPLAASTQRDPRRSGGQPLLDTGRLRNSIAWRPLGQRGVEVGTSVRYAAIHQFGGRAGRNLAAVIPARSYLPTQDRGLPLEYRELLRERISQHLRFR